MRMLTTLDNLLLDRVAQPTVDRLGRRFGWTVPQLASWLFVVDVAGWVVGNAMRYLAREIFGGEFAMNLAIAPLIFWGALWWLRKASDATSSNGHNPLRLQFRFQRPFWLLVTVFVLTPLDTWSIGDLITLTSFYGTNLGGYVASCDAAPPQRQRAPRAVRTPA